MQIPHEYPTERTTVAQGLTCGPALIDEWREAHHEVGGFIEAARIEGFEPAPLFMAWATPGGPVADAVFDAITGQLCEMLRDSRADGLLLALHGAMVTPSHLDAHGEVLARLRHAAGPDLLYPLN